MSLHLFDPDAPVRATDPLSSHVASKSVSAARQRRLILNRLVLGPATVDDCAIVIDRHRSHASTRLNVLRSRGHAEKIGVALRKGDSGSYRDVDLWAITQAGRDWLQQEGKS